MRNPSMQGLASLVPKPLCSPTAARWALPIRIGFALGFAAMAASAQTRLPAAQPPFKPPAATPSEPESVRWQPRMRSESIQELTAPPISRLAFERQLARIRMVSPEALEKSARIQATEDGRVFLAQGDLVFASGLDKDAGQRPAEWHIYRPAQALRDPDTGAILAWETQWVGRARVERDGEPARLRITGYAQEISVGDHLLRAEPMASSEIYAHAPPTGVLARIISIHRGLAQAGRQQLVVLDRGTESGLEPGHLLPIQQPTRDASPTANLSQRLAGLLPVGVLMLVRAHEKVSYGVIIDVDRPVRVGDWAGEP